MPLQRTNKIEELCRYPVGQDILYNVLRQAGRSEGWVRNLLLSKMPVATLDRFGGPGFADALLDIVNRSEPGPEVPGMSVAAPAWWKEAVLYQIFTPSFMDSDHDGIGDFAGIAQRLPYLEKLGVDTLWLRGVPLAPGEKADEQDFFASWAPFGSPEDFGDMLQAAHARGLRVLLGLDIGTAPGRPLRTPAEVRRAMLHWAGQGVDGFCLENIGALCRSGATHNGLNGLETGAAETRLHRQLHELRAGLGVQAPVFTCGELRCVGPQVAKLFTDDERHELDMVFDKSHLTGAARSRLGAETSCDLRLLRRYYLRWMAQYGGNHWMSLFFGTHCTPRMLGRLGANPIYRNILAKLLATMQFTLRGTPAVYQGEELGLGNTRFASAAELRDPEALAAFATLCEAQGEDDAWRAVLPQTADHARVPMPWSAGLNAGFSGAAPWLRLPDGADHLNAGAQMGDPGSVWQHYQKLIALRRQHPALVYGTFNPVFVKNNKVFCYFRIQDNEKWYIEMNLTEKECARPGRIVRGMKLMLSNYESQARALRPYEANIFRFEQS